MVNLFSTLTPAASLAAPRALAAAAGWTDFTFDVALAAGHRVVTLERIFNMKRGLTIAGGREIGPYLLGPAIEGPQLKHDT